MRVNQDSRTIEKGEWFIAVKGKDFDGHSFIPEVLKKGVAGVLEEKDLFELAREKVDELQPKVVAVTGSYGKTSTKEAIYKVLSSKFEVLRASGNLNTPRGIAIEVVNELKPRHQVLVVEMGMDRLGEIAKSCEIVRPAVGVITAVGEMHLEKLKTLARIKRAKAELLRALAFSGGTAILNKDDVGVREIAEGFSGKKLWYGSQPTAAYSFSCLEGVELRLLGEGGRYAALAAFSVGRELGVSRAAVVKALGGLRPLEGRLCLRYGRRGVQIIDDTYNAGPRSAAVALRVLQEFPVKSGRRIAVLGDMLELGRVEEKAHREVVRGAVKIADRYLFVGKRMKKGVESAGAAKSMRSVTLVNNAGDAIEVLKHWRLGRGDVVLVKGSRGMQMEKVVASLLQVVT